MGFPPNRVGSRVLRGEGSGRAHAQKSNHRCVRMPPSTSHTQSRVFSFPVTLSSLSNLFLSFHFLSCSLACLDLNRHSPTLPPRTLCTLRNHSRTHSHAYIHAHTHAYAYAYAPFLSLSLSLSPARTHAHMNHIRKHTRLRIHPPTLPTPIRTPSPPRKTSPRCYSRLPSANAWARPPTNQQAWR